MPSVLHPCPTCGHRSMDDCWSAGQQLLARQRKLCVDCHDECLAKTRRRTTKATPAKSPPKTPDPRMFF